MAATTPTDFVTGTVVTEAMLDNLSENIATGTMRPLADQNPVGSSIIFASIPQTFRHLMIVASGCIATGANATYVPMMMRFNSSNTGYMWQRLIVANTTVTGSEGSSPTAMEVGLFTGTAAPQARDGQFICFIANYRDTSRVHHVSSHGGVAYNSSSGTQVISIHEGIFTATTAAITQIELFPSADSLNTGCRATLYGLAAA